MRTSVFLSLSLAFLVSGAKAEGSSWLADMIAKNEQASTQKEVLGSNNMNKGFFSTHGLVLFYGSQCPHCKQFAPIVKHWATRNEADLLPLSLDNQPLPEFPQFLPATKEWINAAFGGNAINYPAIFVLNPETNALYPVGFGAMTDAELNERMEMLIAKIKAYESKGILS